jgi:hypothetical protein
VTKLVADVEGVTNVVNKMTVPQALSQIHARPSAPQNLTIAQN